MSYPFRNKVVRALLLLALLAVLVPGAMILKAYRMAVLHEDFSVAVSLEPDLVGVLENSKYEGLYRRTPERLVTLRALARWIVEKRYTEALTELRDAPLPDVPISVSLEHQLTQAIDVAEGTGTAELSPRQQAEIRDTFERLVIDSIVLDISDRAVGLYAEVCVRLQKWGFSPVWLNN